MTKVEASPAFPPEVEEAHRAAIENDEPMYTDPFTRLSVFTEATHLERGTGCGSGCRHCPYGHVNVRAKPAAARRPPPKPATKSAPKLLGRKSRVFTRRGDGGSSVLLDGQRRSKDDPAFEAMGAVDELWANERIEKLA